MDEINPEDYWPRLQGTDWRQTSDPDVRYNCLAWSGARDQVHWWQTGREGGRYWPPGVPDEDSVEAWLRIFKNQLFEECEGTDYEAGWEKVAIYVDSEG